MTTTTEPTARPGRRRARRTAAVGLTAVALVALAGCMKVDMALTLSEEDSVSGTVVMAISDDVAESMDMDPQEMWDMADEGEDSLTEGLPEGSTEEPYAEGGYTGTQITLTDRPIAEMNSDDLSITREGDEYVIDGIMDLTDTDMESGEIPAAILESFVMRIAVTFPGEVTETNGTVDGTTVTWEPAFGESTEMTARGSAVGDGGGSGAGTDDDAAPDGEASPEGGATPDDEATGAAPGDTTDEGTGTVDDATDTAATSDAGFPGWALALAILVALAVLGVVVTLIVRNNRTPAEATSSNPDDVFGAQNPPSHQPGQPPVDPYHPGGPPPQQGPR